MSLRVAVLNREARSTRVATARHPCTGHRAQATVHRPASTAASRRAPRPPPAPPAAGARGQALGRGGHRLQHAALRRRRPRLFAHGASSHGGVTVGPWWGHGGSRWGRGGVTVGSRWGLRPGRHMHMHTHTCTCHVHTCARPPLEQADGAGVAAGLHVGDRVVAVQGKVRRGGAPSALWLPPSGFPVAADDRPLPTYPLTTDY